MSGPKRSLEAADTAREDGSYYTEGRQVWRRPERVEDANGKAAIRLGFPVCVVNENICDPYGAARLIAEAMNTHRLARPEDHRPAG